MSRRKILGLSLALAALATISAAGYAWWWFRLADGVRSGIDHWAEARRAEGWRVSFESLATGGFPGVVRIRLDQPRIAAPGRFDWQAPSVTADIGPFEPRRVVLDLAGDHRLAIAGPARPHALDIGLGTARVELLVDATGGDSLHAALGDAVVREVGGKAVSGESIRLTVRRPPTAAGHDTASVAFDAAVAGVHLPEDSTPVFGRRIGLAALRGRLLGTVPAGDAATALAAWRDDGGTVEIDRLKLEWAPLDLAASGTMALDEGMQPLVAMSASVRGFAEAVDAMVRAGAMRAKDAIPAKLILGLLAKSPPEGGAPAIEVPLTVQDGRFYMGPAALGRVPEIPWPRP